MHADTPSDRAAMLRQILAAEDVPCPACGYNLRGLTGDACPECSQKLVLRVGLVEPSANWFVAGAIGLGAGVGFPVLMAIIQILDNGWPNSTREREILAVMMGSLAVYVFLLTAWIKSRGRIARLKPPRRAALAGACLALPVLTAFVMFWILS